MDSRRPLRVALVGDVELVALGLARMVEPFADRVVVVPPDQAGSVPDADIVLIDPSADPAREVDHGSLGRSSAGRVVIWSWDSESGPVRRLLEQGAAGYLSKALPAAELVTALERIHAGEDVVPQSSVPSQPEAQPETQPDTDADSATWSGRDQGLTARESQIIRLITRGLSNQQIADQTFLSVNSVKSYIRSSYRKMGVASRSRAVLWGIEHGFRDERDRHG